MRDVEARLRGVLRAGMSLQRVDGARRAGPELVRCEGEVGAESGVEQGFGEVGVREDAWARLLEDAVGDGVAEEAFKDAGVVAGALGEVGEGDFAGEVVEGEAEGGLEAEEGVVLGLLVLV